jgi:transposase
LRTGAPWRDLPSDYGGWKNTQRRFCRWGDKGLWKRLLETFVTDPDFEWLFIDAIHVKPHAHGTGTKGGTREVGCTKKRGRESARGRGYSWQATLSSCHGGFRR